MLSTSGAALARALGDHPDTVIAVHLLERALCRAYVAGTVDHFDAALVQALHDPEEPYAFGSDAEAIWTLLTGVTGWTCVSAPESVAHTIGAIMARSTGQSVRLYRDLYFTMTTPVHRRHDDHIRYLTLTDLDLLERAPVELRVTGFGSLRSLLVDGFAAGAVVDGELVAMASTSARTSGHADIAVATIREFRGRGLATAAASLVVDAVQRTAAVPVWSTGEDNLASQRVADKLGFAPAGRRTYVIPETSE